MVSVPFRCSVVANRHDPLEKQILDSEQTGNLKAPKHAAAAAEDDGDDDDVGDVVRRWSARLRPLSSHALTL
jgi:hypothetical protein